MTNSTLQTGDVAFDARPDRGAADPAPAGGATAAWLEDNAAGDVVVSPDGWLIDYNRAAARMFRLPAAAEGRPVNLARFCRHPERFAEIVQAVQVTGRLENWDGNFVAFDGTPLHVVANLVGNFDETRTLVSVRACLFNITEWRRGHERTLFGQRVEAIGRLAGGIAHDFNNLLTIIGGHAEVLSLSIPPEDAQRRSVAAIQEAATRAAALTRKLLAFGRRQVLQTRVLDANDLVAAVEADVRRTFGRRIAVGVTQTRPLWPVRVDGDQIERAVGTIAAHAIDAMPDGGALTFATSNVEIGLDCPQARSFVRMGRYTRIEIACDGLVLDVDQQVRVFEPFFSGAGSARDGMGLAAVFGVVKQSGGYIWADTEGTKQTTFTILLPAEAGAEGAATPLARPPAPGSAAATVLVVDDDESVRQLIAKLLQHQGYTVIDAASANDGARLFAAHAVDLLITDVRLDGRSGDQFAAPLMEQSPDLRLIYVSGYPDERGLCAPHGDRAAFLDKPFSAKLLVDRVRHLLAA